MAGCTFPAHHFHAKTRYHYYLPANLNGWYVFGALSLFFLGLQVFLVGFG
ncbi:hypothetical protein [Rickettsiella massiliensis]|nr:hypothetical protein [Rickettsiella massiliensis]